jgi:hypothetical protein
MTEEIRDKRQILNLWGETERAGLELVHPGDNKKIVQVKTREGGTVISQFNYYPELGWMELGWIGA